MKIQLKNLPSLSVVIAGILFTTAIISAHAIDPRTIKPKPLTTNPPAVESFTLENGLRVFFIESHDLPVVRMTLTFPGGSAYEPNELCGVGEVTAAVLRSGGAGEYSGEEVDEELDFLAASISSSAFQDRHELELRCLKKDFARVFDLYTLILTRPQFDTAKLALEISNNQEDIKRQFDSPTGATRQLFYQTVYGGKLYGRYPTLESVSSISLETVRRNYNKVYTPAEGILAVSGDLTPAELETVLREKLGAWKGQRALERPVAQPLTESDLPSPGVYYAHKEISQTSFRLGHLTDLFDNPDRHAVRIMNYAVGVGFTSRLTTKVRSEAGLAYSVGGYFVNRPTRGTYFAYCQTKAESTAEALRMIVQTIVNVRENGITKEEFTRSRESILNSFVFEYETPHQIVESVALNVFYGFPENQTELDLAALSSVTLEDCRRVARDHYSPENFRIVVVGDSTQMNTSLSEFGAVAPLSLDIK